MSKKKKTIVLKSDDGEIFELEEWIATKESHAIKQLLLDSDWERSSVIPIHNIISPALAKVIEYWNCRNDPAASGEEKRWWESEFVRGFARDELLMYEVIIAANFLNSRPLMEVACQAAIKNRVVEQLRNCFDAMNKD